MEVSRQTTYLFPLLPSLHFPTQGDQFPPDERAKEFHYENICVQDNMQHLFILFFSHFINSLSL